jgi:hypothetical protein
LTILTAVAGLRAIISSSTAHVNAACSVLRASLRLDADSVSWQHLPSAQQRFLFSDRAASFPWAQPLTVNSQLVKPLPNVFHFDHVEPLAAEMRDDVQATEHLVFLVRLRREVRFYDFLEFGFR